jgi:hypothetical protein
VSEFARLPGNDGALYESILAGVVSYFPGHVSEAARDFIGQVRHQRAGTSSLSLSPLLSQLTDVCFGCLQLWKSTTHGMSC